MEGFAPRRILVPINGAETDANAVRLACRLALRQHGKVFVVTIVEVRRGLELGEVASAEVDAAEALLESAEAIAKEYEVGLDTELLQAREAGPAIVDEIGEWKADLVVLGMPFRTRFGEFYMGRTAPYVLRSAACRVMLFRDEPPAEA